MDDTLQDLAEDDAAIIGKNRFLPFVHHSFIILVANSTLHRKFGTVSSITVLLDPDPHGYVHLRPTQ